MIELAGLEAADAKIHSLLRALNAQQNGGRKVFGPPDLCRSGSRDFAEGRDVFAFNHTQGGHAYGASECPLSGEQRVLILRLAPHVRGSLGTLGTMAVNRRKR